MIAPRSTKTIRMVIKAFDDTRRFIDLRGGDPYMLTTPYLRLPAQPDWGLSPSSVSSYSTNQPLISMGDRPAAIDMLIRVNSPTETGSSSASLTSESSLSSACHLLTRMREKAKRIVTAPPF